MNGNKIAILHYLLDEGSVNYAIYKSASSASKNIRYMMDVKGLL